MPSLSTRESPQGVIRLIRSTFEGNPPGAIHESLGQPGAHRGNPRIKGISRTSFAKAPGRGVDELRLKLYGSAGRKLPGGRLPCHEHASLLSSIMIAFTGCGLGALLLSRAMKSDPFLPLFQEDCSVCHGENFEGTTLGPALVGSPLLHGDSVDQISASISKGLPEKGMPAWSGILSDVQIRSLAILIAERRVGRYFTDFRHQSTLTIS